MRRRRGRHRRRRGGRHKPAHKKWRSAYKGKKYWHGDNRYRTYPGTKRGDSYCARSYGIIKKYGRTPKNMLSRRKWKCRGRKSIKGRIVDCPHWIESEQEPTSMYCSNECILSTLEDY